jgi:MFS family permease
MSALASDHLEQTIVRSARGKAAGLSGIGFALAYLIGTASLNAPLSGTDQKIVEFWSDGGNQTAAVISMYCFAIAGLLFLVFMSNLRARLATLDTRSTKLSEIVFGSGLVFVVMLFVSGVARGVIGFGTKSHWSQPVPNADLLRYLPQISYAAGGLALLAAAVAITTTSVMILRGGAFGRWLAWLGFVVSLVLVVANGLLAGVAVIPAMLIWALAASFAMWRSSTQDA